LTSLLVARQPDDEVNGVRSGAWAHGRVGMAWRTTRAGGSARHVASLPGWGAWARLERGLPKDEVIMAGIDIGGGAGAKRSVNSEINMIPFIDLLMVTIAFLLITAVWVSFSRLNANAAVPGPPSTTTISIEAPEKELHVHVGEKEFKLVWKQAATVLSETVVPKPEPRGEILRYSDLADKVGEEWALHSGHRDPSDKGVDRAVLHTDNRLPFRDVVAVMDAIYQTQRDFKIGAEVKRYPAFNVTFSSR
jgi:biopolymer transport protein ExbD